MLQQLRAVISQQLLVGRNAGAEYVLVCFQDGGYGITRDGELLPERWGLAESEACTAAFLHLIGKREHAGGAALNPA